MEAPITHISVVGPLLVVATQDRRIHAMRHKGRIHWKTRLPAGVTAMCPMSVRDSQVIFAVAIAMEDGDIRVYDPDSKVMLMSTGPPTVGGVGRDAPLGGSSGSGAPSYNGSPGLLSTKKPDPSGLVPTARGGDKGSTAAAFSTS